MESIDIINEGKKVFEIEIDELQKIKNKIDDKFKKLVEKIYNLNNKKVVITGIGKSGHIGKKIAATLASTGTSTIFINAAEGLHGDLGMISSGDIVIIISNSGNSDEIIGLLNPIKNIGAEIIAFTSNIQSILAKKSDLIIDIGVEREACPIGSAPMASTTVTLVMGDALAAALMKIKKFSQKDFAKYHPGGSLGRRLLLKVEDLLHNGLELPVLKSDSDIESVLLTLTEKKMGAVCITDNGKEKGKLLGIITEGDIRRALKEKEKFFFYVASDIMIKNPISIEKNEMAMKALELMENRESQISVLPVVEGNKLIGIIRLHDLVGLK